jgi:hypothetical protein
MEGIIVLWGLVDNWSISTLFDGMSQEGSWAIEWLDGNISGLVGERLGHGNNSDLMELVQTSIPRWGASEQRIGFMWHAITRNSHWMTWVQYSMYFSWVGVAFGNFALSGADDSGTQLYKDVHKAALPVPLTWFYYHRESSSFLLKNVIKKSAAYSS